MVHMVWVGSQKAQPLLILPLFCHLRANREERGELFSCCLPQGSLELPTPAMDVALVYGKS